MTNEEFIRLFAKLEQALESPQTNVRRSIYYENLKNWPASKLAHVINALIAEWESSKFPQIGSFYKRGAEIQDSAPESKRTPCLLCNEVGSISAVKDGYSTCFRCPKCTNWQGRFSDSIAIWREDYELHGYQLSWHHTDMRLNELNGSDVELVQWLALYMPTLAEKLIAKNPSLVSVIRLEKSDPRREAERRRSLQAEEWREMQ